MRSFVRLLCALLTVAGLSAVAVGGISLIGGGAPAYAEGQIPCVANTQPSFPEAGFCADYNGDDTWYGTYGPGFPTAQGYGLCAEPPASGGGFPAPDYDYVAGALPAGAGGDWNALGFALSEGEAAQWWSGVAGQFTADQAAAAAKLLYDSVVWGSPVPAMDPGVLAAYDDFDDWFIQARGMSNSAPELSVGLTSGSTSFTGMATDQVHLQFPGSDKPMVGQAVLLTITNGTFNTPGGPTEVGVATDADGDIDVPIYSSGSAPVTVTVTSGTDVGMPGLAFWHPTKGELNAQYLAGYAAPRPLNLSQSLSATPAPVVQTGTVSVQKGGDDTAYYGVAGAVFQVLQGSDVMATLTTDASGATPVSGALVTGSYTVHELTPPAGYAAAPDQTVTVVANANTVVSYAGVDEDRIVPATITIRKVDAQGGAPLSGAVMDIRYSTDNNSTFDQDLGTCTTDSAGKCSPAGNDGTSLLPGNYEIKEQTAPTGYFLNPSTALQTVSLTPGETGTVTFSDFLLGSLSLTKSGDDTAYTSVAGAVFSVSGPSPSSVVVGKLTVGVSGSSNSIFHLTPGTYTVTETTPPHGYRAVAPVQVAVPAGHTTTLVNVEDHVIPATVTLSKVDRQTNEPLAGAVLRVAYDPTHSGSYSKLLGTCTTSASGTCTPSGNDGPAALLPGNYQVTEVSAPPGYELDRASATQDVTLTPAEAGTVVFADSLLVAASFEKVATGNVNPALVSLAGAVIDVRLGTATGTLVTTCSTDAAGACATGRALDSGTTYCWTEATAPVGLAGGANGCFTANNTQASEPITVDDAGLFVSVAALKVDAADSSATLAGATFDLYRVDGGHGPGVVPTPPTDAIKEAGETWVARSTTAADGIASFSLQFPGYAYCALEVQAPANYVLNTTPRCTDVLSGASSSPAPVTTVTVADIEQMVTVSAHKFNVLAPDTDIADATYDLYVEGAGPPSGTLTSLPSDAKVETGDTWYARGTTDQTGDMTFTVPAGYAWCLLEHSAPPDYLPDPALHCTSVITESSPPSVDTVALPETLATVYITAHKYNSLQPDTVIAGATYELVVQGPMPGGYVDPVAPNGDQVPAGDSYWGQGTTDANGLLSFGVPAGNSWCLHELAAPAGYQPDPAYHCTAVLTTQTSAATATVALPEFPVPGGGLAFTGGPGWWLPLSGALLIFCGSGLLLLRRRRQVGGRGWSAAGALVDGVDEHPEPGEMPPVESEGQSG